jgi:hypothetical protein
MAGHGSSPERGRRRKGKRGEEAGAHCWGAREVGASRGGALG